MRNEESNKMKNTERTQANENEGRDPHNIRNEYNGYRGNNSRTRNNYNIHSSYNSNWLSREGKFDRDFQRRSNTHDSWHHETNKNFRRDEQYMKLEQEPHRSGFHHQRYTQTAYQNPRRNDSYKRRGRFNKNSYYDRNFHDKHGSEFVRSNEIQREHDENYYDPEQNENPQVPQNTDLKPQYPRKNCHVERYGVSDERSNHGRRLQAASDINYNRTESVTDKTIRTKNENNETMYEYEDWDEQVHSVSKQIDELQIPQNSETREGFKERGNGRGFQEGRNRNKNRPEFFSDNTFLVNCEHETKYEYNYNANFIPLQNDESQFQQKGKREWNKQYGRCNRNSRNWRVKEGLEDGKRFYNDQKSANLGGSDFVIEKTSGIEEMQQSAQESKYTANEYCDEEYTPSIQNSKNLSQKTYESNRASENCSTENFDPLIVKTRQEDEQEAPENQCRTFSWEPSWKNNRNKRYSKDIRGGNWKNYKDNRDNYRENNENNRYHKSNRSNRRQNSQDRCHYKDKKYGSREHYEREKFSSRENSASRARFSEHNDTKSEDVPRRSRSRNSDSLNEKISKNSVTLEKSARDRNSSEHGQKSRSNSRSTRTKNIEETSEIANCGKRSRTINLRVYLKNGESTEEATSTENPTDLGENSKKNESKKKPNEQDGRGKGNYNLEKTSQRSRRNRKKEIQSMRENMSTNVVDSFIKEIKGDLFTAEEEYSLGHCVGADFLMSAGIAVQFSKEFGGTEELLNQEKKVGEVAILKRKNRYIFYLITKKYSNGKPHMLSMTKAVKSLRVECEKLNVTKLALPRIGCGLDRLDWGNVKELLYSEFHETNVEIVVYVQ